MIQGRYLIVQPIGKGGMGEVYLAVDQRLGSAVALKRTFFSEDSTLGSAFEREARILGRLRHPVLPKVIDHFAENGDQFLVMEHISGDDISKRLENANKAFPLSWVMFWADQMLDALAYLHSHEPPIVHRDIKPQNLKLTDDNHIVLLDFGLSKDFDSTSGGHGLNSASVAGYSPHFASMEQIRGTGTDARSDLYSLSATLYQMLTNTIPPDALTRADALIGGKPDPIKPLTELNPEISPAISDVILKAVSIRQDERYATALEMQKMLRRAFNKDRAEPDAKPVMGTADPEPQYQDPIDTAAPKPDTVQPEMETRIRDESPVPLDVTLQMNAVPTNDELNTSEFKTAIFTAPEVSGDTEEPAPAPVSGQLSEQEEPQSQPQVRAMAAAGTAQTASVKSSVPKPPTRPKSSKMGLVVGVLAGLLLLGGMAGAAGWYLLKGGANSGKAAPTPAPVSSPIVAADTNTNTSNNIPAVEPLTNSETTVENANTDESNSNSTTETRSTSPTTKGVPGKSTQSTSPKSTPKPKRKDDRTVILP